MDGFGDFDLFGFGEGFDVFGELGALGFGEGHGAGELDAGGVAGGIGEGLEFLQNLGQEVEAIVLGEQAKCAGEHQWGLGGLGHGIGQLITLRGAEAGVLEGCGDGGILQRCGQGLSGLGDGGGFAGFGGQLEEGLGVAAGGGHGGLSLCCYGFQILP